MLFQDQLFVVGTWSTCKIQDQRQEDTQQQQGEEGMGAKESLVPHESGPGGTGCSEMPGGDMQWQSFLLVFPSGRCFPAEQLCRTPRFLQTSTSPQETPPSPCQNSNFVDIATVIWGKSVNETSLEHIPFFPPLQFGQNLSKEQDPHPPCSPRTNSIHFNITSFPVPLVKWERRRKSRMRITQNCYHLKFDEAIFSLWILSSLPKPLCSLYGLSTHAKSSPREGPKAGTPGKCFTLCFLPSALSLQQCFHRQVRHPKDNQCLNHLKTGLSQPMKRTGFNVCRSTKARSPEHLTYWRAMWKGNVFLQVASYFGSSEESISIAVSHTDRAPHCLYSPRCCKSLVLTTFYTKIIIPINVNCVGKFKL